VSFICGKYAVTYGTSPGSAGQTGFNTLRVSHQVFKQLIIGDNFAQAPQDAVYQGAEMFVQFTMIEYNASKAAAIFWPYGTTIYDMGVIGRLDVGVAEPLILTALAGTPAAATPATLTFADAILAEGFPVEWLYAPSLREVPIRQRIYPSSLGVFAVAT
jgi:hypothetical protein